MTQITKAQMEQLKNNWKKRDQNHKPVVKLFTPDAQCTWLLSEVEPDNPDIAFWLCDLGMWSPELWSVSLNELSQIRWWLWLPVERDLSFEADKTLTEYADEARSHQRILASSK